MARAQDVMRGLLVQRHGAAHVRADLGVGDDVVDRPVHRAYQRTAVRRGRNVQLTRAELDQDDGRLGQRVRVVLIAVGHDRDHAARRAELGRGDRLVGALQEQSPTRAPHGSPQAGTRQRTHVPEQHERGGEQRQRAEHQGAPHQRPLDELAIRRALFEVLLERLPVLRVGPQFVPLLDHLDVRHQVPHPDQRAQAEGGEGEGKREAQSQVGAQGLVDRVHPEADVGGDEAAAGDERERKAGRDHPLGPLAVRDHRWVVRREAVDVLLAFGIRDLARVAMFGHRCRAEQARRGRWSADHPVRRNRNPRALGPSVSSMSLMFTTAPSPSVLDHAAWR